ncbi:MAG: type II toxin-antitoxin system VapC family toxin [Acidimicrobiales bacterium]
MKLLLDTHVWLWMLAEPDRLSDSTRQLIQDRRTALYLSAVSSGEIAIKHALGRLPRPEPPEHSVPARMRTTGVRGLPIEHAHALHVDTLEMHHRDPFDRLLVAQSQVEGLPLLTADRVFERYDIEVMSAE